MLLPEINNAWSCASGSININQRLTVSSKGSCWWGGGGVGGGVVVGASAGVGERERGVGASPADFSFVALMKVIY